MAPKRSIVTDSVHREERLKYGWDLVGAGATTMAYQVAKKLTLQGYKGRALHHLSATTRYYVGGTLKKQALLDLARIAMRVDGGQHYAEVALCCHEHGRQGDFVHAVGEIRRAFREQRGFIRFLHPSALLELATLLDAQGNMSGVVEELICSSLSERPIMLDDLTQLARLLERREAPLTVWGDWAFAFSHHLSVMGTLVRIPGLERPMYDWALGENQRSKGVLEAVLQKAPSELIKILIELARCRESNGFAEVLEREFSPSNRTERRTNRAFAEKQAVECRFPWLHAMVQFEQGAILNAEAAFQFTPTNDYSMAVSQWWRALESMLMRTVIADLGALLDARPELLRSDRETLSKKWLARESVLLDDLADAERRNRMTLVPMLRVLEKAVSNNSNSPSRVRAVAAERIQALDSQIRPLVMGSPFANTRLSQAFIQRFRNHASHDKSMSEVEAIVGRILAGSLIRDFLKPVILNTYGERFLYDREP